MEAIRSFLRLLHKFVGTAILFSHGKYMKNYLKTTFLNWKLTIFCFVVISCGVQEKEDEPSNTFWGSYEIESQAVLEDFASNDFTTVKGNLFIYNCEDLSPLSTLETIEGKLEIRTNKLVLEDLQGLENIKTIDGDLNIYLNTGLKTLEGLDNLESLSGNIAIYENSRLETLSNLDRISRVEGFVSVYSNPNLVSLDGLNQISEITNYLSVNNNKSLTHLNSFDNLARVGDDVSVSNNQALERLDALNRLISVEDRFEIIGNEVLIDVSSLQDLTSVEVLSIKNNSSLTDFCVFGSVTVVDTYSVTGNAYNPTQEELENEDTCKNN